MKAGSRALATVVAGCLLFGGLTAPAAADDGPAPDAPASAESAATLPGDDAPADAAPVVLPQVAAPARRVIGHSVEGRAIRADYRGPAYARTTLVVVGQMHGDEPAGRAVVDRLARLPLPRDVGLWLVTSMNPDGHADGERANARGVDLNRNFPERWRRLSAAGRTTGPRAASEPETRAMTAFLREVRPDALVSFHQPFGIVDTTHPGSRAAARLLARAIGLPAGQVGCGGPCHGTMTGWTRERLGAIAVTVELPARVPPALTRRAAAAVMRLGAWLGQ